MYKSALLSDGYAVGCHSKALFRISWPTQSIGFYLVYFLVFQLSITGAVFSLDGKECIMETVFGTLPDPAVQPGSCPHAVLTQSSIYVPEGVRDSLVAAEKLGEQLAQALIARGAERVLRAAREGKDASN